MNLEKIKKPIRNTLYTTGVIYIIYYIINCFIDHFKDSLILFGGIIVFLLLLWSHNCFVNEDDGCRG